MNMAFKLTILFAAVCCARTALALTSCPDGWTKYHSSCYLFPNVKAAWGTASVICRELRQTAHLVEIETAEENNFLENTLRGFHTQDNYWTGGNDIENEGEWLWESSRTKFGYNDWDTAYPGNIQPNNIGHHEDCMEIDGHFSDHWHDAPCSSQLFFICEIELEDAVPNIVG